MSIVTFRLAREAAEQTAVESKSAEVLPVDEKVEAVEKPSDKPAVSQPAPKTASTASTATVKPKPSAPAK
jgi:hypothetical protein